MDLIFKENIFVISNKQLKHSYKNDIIFLFGYCFTDNTIIKNRIITSEEYNYINENRNEIGGIFVVIHKNNNKISMIIDPLVQYNIFYYFTNKDLTISNNIFEIAKNHNLRNENKNFIHNYALKQCPLAGNTLIENVFILQYDDIYNPDFSNKFKKIIPHSFENFVILKMKNDIYDNFNYFELKQLYINKLMLRSKIIQKTFTEIYISLTGGADSRLVTSLFMNNDNVYYYCYGDGKRQDRLVSEYIIERFKLKKGKRIPVVGNKVKTVGDILQCIEDSNSHKLNLNLYINSPINNNCCNLTGYYGANICGGIPIDIPSFINGEKIYPNEYNYISDFKTYYSNLRSTTINDLFYVNNRGLSHYSCHSIANNKYGNSFDILIDPINLKLVEKCPYTDYNINRNSITIDLIFQINDKLALLPYDNRIIPLFKKFENIPEFNCFTKHIFDEKQNIHEYIYIRNIVKKRAYNLFKSNCDCENHELMYCNELKYIYRKYDYILNTQNNVSEDVFKFFLYSVYYLHNLNNLNN